MVIEPRVVQFWSEIILVISNRTRAARSFDFEITRMISAQIALQSVQLPSLIIFHHNYLRHNHAWYNRVSETNVSSLSRFHYEAFSSTQLQSAASVVNSKRRCRVSANTRYET